MTTELPLIERSNLVTRIYQNGMINITSIYVGKYRENKEACIEFLKVNPVALSCVVSVYSQLVKGKEITAIEDLPKEKKLLLINEVGNCENLISVCKAVYLIQCLL